MEFAAWFLLAGAVALSRAQSHGLNLQADPQVVIPGLTQTLTITCGPGHLAHQYRQVLLLQILSTSDGSEQPLASLHMGHEPTVHFSEPGVTVNGSLDMLNPESAVLKLTVHPPSFFGAIQVECQVVGLGKDGNVLKNKQSLSITVHPESGLVDTELKMIVAALKTEADGLWAQTQTLHGQNQRLSQLVTSKRTALTQKKADLLTLKKQVKNLQQTLDAQEIRLNDTAEDLVQEIADVAAHAPAMRVAFNAQENMERVSASGHQLQFETVEMNEGQGYNGSTSIFRAPVQGVYYFTSSQLAHETAGAAAVRVYTIRKNSTIVAGASNCDDHQSSTYRQSSTSALLSLSPYDVVRVYQQYSSSGVTAISPGSNTPNDHSTNFAGYLLH